MDNKKTPVLPLDQRQRANKDGHDLESIQHYLAPKTKHPALKVHNLKPKTKLEIDKTTNVEN